MINSKIINDLETYSNAFASNTPFKHVVIDDFLDSASIEKIVKDFPPFDKKKALNENGQVGPKCVHTDLASISPFYKKFFQYISSPDFLEKVEDISGIKGLIFDDRMYGAGTHENVSGAELDIHVDFNYDTSNGYHRRLNLLLYLNDNWNEDWGGAIQIVNSPLKFYDHDFEINSYNCIKNRLLMFETNEYSWHGFPRINIPDEHSNISRKLISIYLYTKDRPQEEIVANHGTFYFPYAPQIGTGYDQDQTRRLIKKRDALLFQSYKKEVALSQEIENLKARVFENDKKEIALSQEIENLKARVPELENPLIHSSSPAPAPSAISRFMSRFKNFILRIKMGLLRRLNKLR